MYLDAQTIITFAALISAVMAIFGVIFAVYRWYLRQDAKDRELSERLDKLKAETGEEIKRIKTEECLLCYGISACLDGLMQLGANHTVPAVKEKIDKYLNRQAHDA